MEQAHRLAPSLRETDEQEVRSRQQHRASSISLFRGEVDRSVAFVAEDHLRLAPRHTAAVRPVEVGDGAVCGEGARAGTPSCSGSTWREHKDRGRARRASRDRTGTPAHDRRMALTGRCRTCPAENRAAVRTPVGSLPTARKARASIGGHAAKRCTCSSTGSLPWTAPHTNSGTQRARMPCRPWAHAASASPCMLAASTQHTSVTMAAAQRPRPMHL
eukprot:7375182-Prymnesium_polylepis.1